MMKEAYLEHVNRHLTRRAYPERMVRIHNIAKYIKTKLS